IEGYRARVLSRSQVRRMLEFIDFHTRLEPKHPSDLRTTQDPRTIALNRERLKRVPRQVTPLRFQVVLNILGNFNSHCHDDFSWTQGVPPLGCRLLNQNRL